MKEALGHMCKTFGSLLAVEFGPLKLKAVRQQMIDAGLARGVINNRVNRIKRVIKWAVSEELLPAGAYEAVQTVSGLRFGRSEAKETEPVRPVPDSWVDATVPYLSPQVSAMVQLQRLTGMRPGEVIRMRPCDIDVGDEVWVYRPENHKNRWRGHERLVPLGPQAKAIIQPFWNRRTDAFLFSPQDAEAWRNRKRSATYSRSRKTKIYPCELRARLSRRSAKRPVPKRPKGEAYTPDSYRRAIQYGIRKANRVRSKVDPGLVLVPSWHPNQLRHSFGTAVRKRFGVEAAQVGLGHARTDVVEIYAEKNYHLAVQVANTIG